MEREQATKSLDPQAGQLLLVGVDYHTAPLEIRENVARSREGTEELLVDLLARPEIAEAFVLSTCNRTETYVRPYDDRRALRTALDLTFGRHREQIESEGRFFVLRDHEASRHLLCVAAGLESMVLGEPEILGQVKRAGEVAEETGAWGDLLRRLVRRAVATGRRSRNETDFGAGAVSLGYAVVELARQIFTRLDTRQAVFVGAGETARLALTAMREKGAQKITVVNRSPERAAALVDSFPGTEHRPFDDLYEVLATADIAVAATSARGPIVAADEMQRVMRQRSGRPLLLVDLGVPRNVEQEVGGLENLFLHDIDSLRHLIDRNLEQRRSQIPSVEAIVDIELGDFLSREGGRAAEPLVAMLQRRAEELRRQELERVRDRFPDGTHEDLERLTKAIVRKLLHHPSTRLRAGGADHASRLEVARELFQLENDERERP